MKTLSLVLLSLVAGAGMSHTVADQPFRTDINPALQYYQALLVVPQLSPQDRDYLLSQNWRGKVLPDRFGQLLNRYDNQFRLVRQARHATIRCDWGIDMSPGPATLLPQLSRVKAITQAARLRAMWSLQSGRESDAIEDLLAAFALARNAVRDGTLISALVQMAGENTVCATVAENFSSFSGAGLKRLLDGMDSAPPRVTVAECIPLERVSFLDWFLGRIADLQHQFPHDDGKVMDGIHEIFTGLIDVPGEGQAAQDRPDRWKQILQASGGTSAGLVTLLQDEIPLYARAGRILSLPRAEYEAEIKQFTAEIEQSRNPLGSLTFPAIAKCRPKEFAIEAALAMVRAAVAYKITGDAGLRAVQDPLGAGPFQFQRFVFEGVDRGIKLQSAYDGRGFPEVLIFVEKPGVPFEVNGKEAGQRAPN
jgi:hypothetical protein